MIETAYISTRQSVKHRTCTIARCGLRKKGSTSSKATAYLGQMRGRHIPREVVAYTRLSPGDDVWQWVDEQGFERLPVLSSGD